MKIAHRSPVRKPLAVIVGRHRNKLFGDRKKMKITRRQIKFISAVVLLTTFLTWFFYAHETLPKPIRAATALIETPVAIASGLSYYLKLGIPVYDTPWAIILSNLLCSVLVIYLADKIFNRRKKHNATE